MKAKAIWLDGETHRSAVLKFSARPASGMAFLNVPLESCAPEMVQVSRFEVLRGGIYHEEFMAQRTLPRNSTELSEERVVSHGSSIDRQAVLRNLRR